MTAPTLNGLTLGTVETIRFDLRADIETITKLIGSRVGLKGCNRLKPFMKKIDEKRCEMCSDSEK